MIEKWIKYWRNSLADAERMERNLNKMEYYQLDELDLSSGQLPVPQTVNLIDYYERKINKQRGADSPKDEDWIEINEVPVIISTFAVLPAFEHSKKIHEFNKIYPFWINAVAGRTGKLFLPDNRYPIFIRRALDPATNEDQILSISSVDEVDRVMEEGIPYFEDWSSYWNFLLTFFTKVTKQELHSVSLENLHVKSEFIVAVDDTIEGASDGIIKLYDKLLESQENPELLKKLTDSKGSAVRRLIPEKVWYKLMDEHVGQMGDEFSLSWSQRQSLHHYASIENGDILAVNGPPGTGKTTLIQSIVANEYVNSAIKGEDPFIILASSTNNQAVTNIIESFAGAKSKLGKLAQRWIPEINSYALYLPSSSANIRKGVHYALIDGTGLPSDIETTEFLESAKEEYLDQLNAWTGEEFSQVSEGVTFLQTKVKAISNTIREAVNKWKLFLSVEKVIKGYCESKSIDTYYNNNEVNTVTFTKDKLELERLLEGYYEIKQTESIWLVIFSFLKFVRERRAIPYKRLFEASFLNVRPINYDRVNDIEDVLKSRLGIIEKILDIEQIWRDWKSNFNLQSNPPELFNELDLGLRHEAFLLATHYWEGRWILETEDAVAGDILRKNGEPNMKRRYRRYAMLTPCFVSTFFMAPKFFLYSRYEDERYNKYPLSNFIDLLIVDEAGQVSPEIGAATFALAKKSLVVGDIKQIDPIWKIPKAIDNANLQKFDLLGKDDDFEDFNSKGFTSSAGSIMKLAQHASFYHAEEKEAKGMMLVEHRRCFDEIIEYCNDLAYHGLLKAKRGSIKRHKEYPLPAVGYMHIAGESKRENGSRVNEYEAVEIINWLVTHHDKIFQFYGNGKKKKFEEYVGIVTPFAAQKHAIQRCLKKAGFDIKKLTVGTVHSLQGAERAIIIFSPVYASNETSRSFFFDQGVNMLNVAVSRAKDSFLVFGDMSVLNGDPKRPSGLLMKHLRKRGMELVGSYSNSVR